MTECQHWGIILTHPSPHLTQTQCGEGMLKKKTHCSDSNADRISLHQPNHDQHIGTLRFGMNGTQFHET